MPASPPDAMLSVRHLSRSFGNVRAVQDLSLEVHRGEIFGFLGPNGAGKTTTISMICGLLRPDTGEILVDGAPPGRGASATRARMGLCPQDVVLWRMLTCFEQIEFVARQHGVDARRARRRADELLDVLGLSEKRNRLAGTLSGGMMRRLNLALALAHDPDFLILDEPQAGLDPQSRVLVREYIRSLAGDKTVLLTTHDMAEVDRMADRIAIIDHGRLLVLDTPDGLKSRVGPGDILEIGLAGSPGPGLDALGAGPPDQLRAEPPGGIRDTLPDALRAALPDTVQDVRMTADLLRLVVPGAMDLLPAILDGMREAGLHARDIRLREKTLEDVFISLTGRSLRE